MTKKNGDMSKKGKNKKTGNNKKKCNRHFYEAEKIDLTKQKIYEIPEYKLESLLERERKRGERKNRWIAPLGIWISQILNLTTTSDFNHSLGLTSDAWYAFHVIVLAVITIWLIYEITNVLKSRKNKKDDDFDDDAFN